KRAPANRPPYVEVATFAYPSGRRADEVVVNNAAALVYVVNLGCIELHPHAVRAEDMDRPDELRIDLDPVPGVGWPQIVEVAKVAREVLGELGLVGWPKTSGSRGAHLWVRIHPRWPFAQVKRAAQAFAREVERRAPELATAKWAKEQRQGVFLDYNQNARDRTTCCAYSVRARDDARVSMPLSGDEFVACDPAAFTLRTVPARLAARGDAHADIDAHPGSLEPLLELADRQGDDRAASPKLPVITIAQAKHKADALAGLERWKARHPHLAAKLAPEDILVDANRGRATAWYRVRINLKNIPPEEQPPPEPMDPAYDPKTEYLGER
ncbi:MAG: DNA polymerase domain-containing protein, partial [Acidobacteriota bacterium]